MDPKIHPNFEELYGEGKLNIEKWKIVKDKIYKINTTNEEDTLPDYRITLELLKIFNSDKEKTDQLLADPAVKKFFVTDFIPTSAKYLLLNKGYRLNECAILHDELLLASLRFANNKLAAGEDNTKLCEAIKIVLNPEKAYFKLNFTDEDNTAVFGEDFVYTEERKKWNESLKIGDEVDAIKVDTKYKKYTWSRAIITDISPASIKIIFKNDTPDSERILVRNSYEIDTHGSRTATDFDWRFKIKKGDLVDVCDTAHVWYTCTIIDVQTLADEKDENKAIHRIFVAYRQYHESGDKLDDKGNRYSGWSSKYDEWINVTHPRVQGKGKMAKKLCLQASKLTEDLVVDDSNDIIYEKENIQNKRYAIVRQNGCKSKTLVRILNTLGEEGFFDNILKKISQTGGDNWCSIETLAPLVTALGQIHSLLFRPFALDFIPKLKNAVFQNLLKSPDSNIRTFTKDRIEAVVAAMDNLLKRAFSLGEKVEMIEHFNLELAMICFKSNFLNSKIHGLKAIIDITRQIKKPEHFKNLTIETLMKRLNEQKVFEELYSSSSHSQLIQRSGDFLRFLLEEDQVSVEKIGLIWSGTRSGNKESLLSIYKVFSDASIYLKSEHILLLIDKISEISLDNLSIDEIELVFDISRFSSKGEECIKRANDFMWDLVCTRFDKLNKEVGDKALNKYCDLMKAWDKKEDRQQTILNCLQNLKLNSSVLSSLKIIRKVIESFPLKSEELTQWGVLRDLCVSNNLLDVLLTSIKKLKESVIYKLPTDGSPLRDQDINAGENISYLTHISELISFLQFVVNHLNSEYSESSEEVSKLTGFAFLSSLWSELVHKSILVDERNLIFKWFKDFASLKNTSFQEISEFFKKIVIADERQAKQMTLEGFNCFKSLFTSINYHEKAMIKQEKQSYQSSGGVLIDGTYYSSFSSDYKAEPEQEFQVVVFPRNLEGITFLWNLVFLADEDAVVENAIQFLNKIYIYLSPDLEKEEDVISIRTEYLSTSIENLEKLIEDKTNLKEEEFQRKILRCLQLLNYILGESEKNGVGDVKSHSSLVKGEVMSFNVTNDISYGVDVPKKIDIKINSNKTIYDLKVEISKQAKCSWDGVKLFRAPSMNGKEIKDSDNGRTIGELRLKNNESLIADKRPTPLIPQVALTNSDGSLVPAAKALFSEWFNHFSENGKMNSDKCADFINSCTNDNCGGEDRRVKEVFVKWDDDKDGFLTLENFLKFYTQACNERPGVVWSNLAVHHIRNDLKKASEIEAVAVNVQTLPRWILRNNSKFYHIMFSLLDEGGKIEGEVWKLLNRIPTSPELMEKIVNLEGVKGQQSPCWENIFYTNSKYRLLYALSVVEYLMEDEDEEPKKPSGDKDPEAETIPNEKKVSGIYEVKEWRTEFILFGGFEQLFNIFKNFANSEYQNLDLFDKNTISFIMKILKNYLTATLANNVPHLYKLNQLIRYYNYNLDTINDYVRSWNKDDPLYIQEQQKKTVAYQKIEEKKLQLLRAKVEETQEFLSLMEKLQGKPAEKILSTLHFNPFLNQIINLIYDTLINTTADLETEDRLIIEYGLCIFISIVLHDQESQKHVLSLEKLQTILVEGLFCSKSPNVRKYFSHTFFLMTIRNRKVFSKAIIKILLENIPSSQDLNRKDCNQFYELLCKLLEEGFKGDDSLSASDAGLDYEGLIKKVITNIREHSSTEKRSNPQDDKILIGYLNLCEKIFQLESSLKYTHGDFALDLFKTCLFEVNPQNKVIGDFNEESDVNKTDLNYVKCKGVDSRKSAYKIIIQLLRKNLPNFSKLLEEGILPLLKTIPIPSVWNFSPSMDTKSIYGYVGLKNLGCICYMNAMLQQFFMCTTFRYAMLMTDDKQPENLAKPKNKSDLVDDNVLHQLQKMFAFLELTDRQDYNPFEFCFSFKDFSGEPVNVSVQQDAQEFLNMIFDKLEFAIKPTPFKQVLEGIYGGKTSTEFICSECNFVRSREENFYNLSVGVKTNKNIYESFEKFIGGEVISDYLCDNCNKKVDITKRCVISYLPNVLIVHLQRIVFDLDTLMNQKINSRLEFPHELNLEPYTKEGLQWRENKRKPKAEGKDDEKEPEENAGEAREDGMNPPEEQPKEEGPYSKHPKEYYEYKLKGVVVHTGTADFGHYYSYINIKNSKWLEFNDSTIRDFDPKNIESECFGGMVSGDGGEDNWGFHKMGAMRETSKNAYILVYERKVKDSLKLVLKNNDDKEILQKAINLELEPSENFSEENPLEKLVDYFSIKKFIPENIYKKVWDDNHRFMLERHIYHDDFFKFMKDLILNVDVPSDLIRPQDINFNNPDQKYPELIYSDHQNIPKENQLLYKNILEILLKLLFEVLAHAQESPILIDLTHQFKMFMSLIPHHAGIFLEEFVLSNPKKILTLLLNCPEKNVKWAMSQVLLNALNICVTLNGFSLTQDGEPVSELEQKILNFLEFLLSNLHTEVAKNWNRMYQYLEFWRDFSMLGEVFVQYLFRKDMIAIMLDFFLERASPLVNFSEKKHPMGNRFSLPPFDPLIHLVSLLLGRVKNVTYGVNPSPYLFQGIQHYNMSDNARRCLKTSEFYEKSLREGYNPQALSTIVMFMAFDDDMFSYSISSILIRGLSRANYDEARPYLEVIGYFLTIHDIYQNRRLEWILGFPQPLLNKFDNYALVSSLEDQTFHYETTLPLDYSSSLLNMVYQNRKKYELLCMVCLNKLLQVADCNSIILDYLLYLPAPSPLYGKYTDWMLGFIENFNEDIQRYYYNTYSVANRELVGKETLKLYMSVDAKIKEKLAQFKKLDGVPVTPEGVLESFNRQYVYGRTLKEVTIKDETVAEKEGLNISVVVVDVIANYVSSLPTGKFNLAFPEEAFSGPELKFIDVDKTSNLLNFFHVRNNETAAPETTSDSKNPKELKLFVSNNQKQETAQNSSPEPPSDTTGDNNKNTEEVIAVSVNPPEEVVVPTKIYNIPQEEGSVFRRFLIKNPSNYLIRISFLVYAKANNNQIFDIGSRIPNYIIAHVKPRSTSQVLALYKHDPSKDWFEFDYKVQVEFLQASLPTAGAQGTSGTGGSSSGGSSILKASALNLDLVSSDANNKL